MSGATPKKHSTTPKKHSTPTKKKGGTTPKKHSTPTTARQKADEKRNNKRASERRLTRLQGDLVELVRPWLGLSVCVVGIVLCIGIGMASSTSCPVAAVEHGLGCSGADVAFGDSCAPQCAPGYTATKALLSCSIPGGPLEFACTADPCPVGEVENGAACGGQLINYNESCGPACDKGYTATSELLECLEPGSALQFACLPDPCQVAAAEHAAACAGTNIAHGRTCHPQCAPGYTPSKASLVCAEPAGQLTFACLPNPCEVARADHEQHCSGRTLAFGSSCRPACAQGYTSGKEVLACLEPEDHLAFLCNPDPCQVASVEQGTECSGAAVEHGQQCRPACEKGYTPSAESLECVTPGGALSFTCLPDTCTVAPAEHGLACAREITFLESCDPKCEPGYRPSESTLDTATKADGKAEPPAQVEHGEIEDEVRPWLGFCVVGIVLCIGIGIGIVLCMVAQLWTPVTPATPRRCRHAGPPVVLVPVTPRHEHDRRVDLTPFRNVPLPSPASPRVETPEDRLDEVFDLVNVDLTPMKPARAA